VGTGVFVTEVPRGVQEQSLGPDLGAKPEEEASPRKPERLIRSFAVCS